MGDIIGMKVITYNLLNNEKGIAFSNKLRNEYDLISDKIVTESNSSHIEIKIGTLIEDNS